DSEFRKSLSKYIPMGRIAEPEDLVGAVIFLASGASSYITGETIVVDGGYLAV
ncbi:MAG: SDR family oxidoreductase, partial [Dehalococcoidia bacterium]|nr:SDR family oxidoreductase [Dehalococcoidia bacterium]